MNTEWTATLKPSDKVIYKARSTQQLCEVTKITPTGLINVEYYEKYKTVTLTFYPDGRCRTKGYWGHIIPCAPLNMAEYEEYRAAQLKCEAEEQEIDKAKDIIRDLFTRRKAIGLEKARIINKYLGVNVDE